MIEKLNIKLNNPCSEKFEQFSKTKKGGFCNSCCKEVINFSSMNDKEILNYFNTNTNNTCGYFSKDQLKTYSNYNVSTNKFNFWNKSLMGFSIVSLLSFNYGIAQDKKAEININKTQNKNFNNKTSDTLRVPKKIIVKGTVSDEMGTLPGAILIIKNTTIGVTTNIDGNFEFAHLIDRNALIEISFFGSKKVELKASEINGKNIILEYGFVSGEVTTSLVFKSKKSFLQKIAGFFRKN